MKVLSAFPLVTLFATAASAQPATSQIDSQEVNAVFAKFMDLMSAGASSASATNPPDLNACWKDLLPGPSPSSSSESDSCPSGFEPSLGKCYPVCGDSFIGWGPFCIPKLSSSVVAASEAKSYPRVALSAGQSSRHVDTCPSGKKLVFDTCVANQCPDMLPFDCAFLCTKGPVVCSKYVGQVGSLLVKAVTALQQGDVMTAFDAFRTIFIKLSSTPKCQNIPELTIDKFISLSMQE